MRATYKATRILFFLIPWLEGQLDPRPSCGLVVERAVTAAVSNLWGGEFLFVGLSLTNVCAVATTLACKNSACSASDVVYLNACKSFANGIWAEYTQSCG